MEIEITNLKIIFKEISYRNINNGNLKDRDRTGVSHSKIGKEIYMQEARRAFCNKTEDEMQNTYHLLEQSMFDPVTKKNSVFNAVMALAEKLLIYDGEEIRCKVDELLRWREVSFQLGEDLLTCAFLAAEDLRYGITTKFLHGSRLSEAMMTVYIIFWIGGWQRIIFIWQGQRRYLN